jgi:DNA transposition AAA+ family ATPase
LADYVGEQVIIRYDPRDMAEIRVFFKGAYLCRAISLSHAGDTADFSDAQAIAAIARITSGNFRLIQRLFVQIQRILSINELTLVTSDVVEAARTTLVIGDTGP